MEHKEPGTTTSHTTETMVPTPDLRSVLASVLKDKQLAEVLTFLGEREVDDIELIKSMSETNFASLMSGIQPEGRQQKVLNAFLPLRQASAQNVPPPTVNRPRRYPIGEILPDPTKYFVVDRTNSPDVEPIKLALCSGGAHLFHGPRQSSKTTTMLQLLRSLPNYISIYMSMEDVDTKLSIYACISTYIRHQYPQLPHMAPSKAGFDTYFVTSNFPYKNVIFVMDEFDYALALPDKNELLMSIRAYKTKALLNGALHTFAGVGTFEMITLITAEVVDGAVKYVSPFNLSNFTTIPNFSRVEHKDLHITQAGLPADFEQDIWIETKGKPGGSVFLGDKALAYIRSLGFVDIFDWQKKKKSYLTAFAGQPTMQKMLDTVKTTEAKKLLHEILRQNRPRQLSTSAEKDAAIQLAASGAVVVDPDNGAATISAPLIQQVLMYNIVVEKILVGVTKITIVNENGVLDIPQILLIAVQNLDWKAVLSPHCTKDLRVQPFRTRPDERQIADEQVFQSELFFILRSLLLDQLGLPVQVCLAETKEKSVDTSKRLDIYITNHSCYVLELCANVDAQGVDAHVAKTFRYAEAYGSNHNFCINFVGFDFQQIEGYPAPGRCNKNGKTVELIYVRYCDTTAFPGDPGPGPVIIYTSQGSVEVNVQL
jgi:hypothetical protein